MQGYIGRLVPRSRLSELEPLTRHLSCQVSHGTPLRGPRLVDVLRDVWVLKNRNRVVELIEEALRLDVIVCRDVIDIPLQLGRQGVDGTRHSLNRVDINRFGPRLLVSHVGQLIQLIALGLKLRCP